MRSFGVLLLLFSTLPAGASASVDEPMPPEETGPVPAAEAAAPVENRFRSWHVLVEATTEFPVAVGGRLELEMPGRLRIGGSFGVIPSFYVDAAESVVVAIDPSLDPVTVELARSAFERSLVARGFVAWSPFRGRSLYLLAGYAVTKFGGDLTSTEVLQDAVGYSGTDPINGSADLDTTLHGIHGELGYRFYAGPVTFRLSLGFTGTVASRTRIDVFSDVAEEDARALAEDGEAYLDDVFTRYAMVPTLGFGIGYDFGF